MKILDFFKRNTQTDPATKETNVAAGDARESFRVGVRQAAASTAGWVGGINGPFTGNKSRTFLDAWKNPAYVNHTEIRRAMRSAWVDSSETRGLVNRLVENVINTGLYPEPKPAYSLIAPDMDREERTAFERDVHMMFDMWARSQDADAKRRHTFYQLQARALEAILIDGEILSVMRYKNGFDRVSPLTLQSYNPDQLVNPSDPAEWRAVSNRGNYISQGIEKTPDGEPVAYYFRRPDGQITRITAYGPKSRRRFVLHPMTTLFPEHDRGTSVLAPIVHELSKITDYSVSELAAAVMNATIAAWVEPSDEQDSSRPLDGVKRRDSGELTRDTNTSNPPAFAEFDRPGVVVQNLQAGEKLNSYNTQRPNVNFEKFVDAVMKNVSASVSVPVEVLRMSFNQNYSASRASLLLFWNRVKLWRADMVAWFLQPVYEQWFAEEVTAGNIIAPGFNSVRGRRAWTRCNWVGINHPSIDPLKEAKAANQRIMDGLTTRDREAAAYNGTDFGDNVSELATENEQLAEANAPMEMMVELMMEQGELFDPEDDTE